MTGQHWKRSGEDGLIWWKGQNKPVLAEFTKANYLEASLYKARHVEVFMVSPLVAQVLEVSS
jgi:hypothetical protein